jgi:hypothetical protein
MKEFLMSLICPQCSQVNKEATVFCRTCGYRFQGNEQEVDEAATMRPSSLAGLPAEADPSETLKPGPPPVSQPTPVSAMPPPQTPIVPAGPAYGQSAPQQQSPFFSQPAPVYAPQQQAPIYGQYPPQGGYGAPVAPAAPVPASPSFLTTLQRGFAGKGTPVHHQSWLLEGKQVAPQTLNSAFIANLQKQNVLGVLAEHERLREYGTVLEERDYVKVRYGASSVFIYLAPMGQNLYVSRTSTIQQPYSRVRIAVLISLVVLALISLIFALVINPSSTADVTSYYSAQGIKGFFEYVFDGLLIFFIAALLRSLVFWLTDKDFLAILRPNKLSDFSLDALASIEQTTDKALYTTLQDASLDAEVITLSQSTTPQQALHRI